MAGEDTYQTILASSKTIGIERMTHDIAHSPEARSAAVEAVAARITLKEKVRIANKANQLDLTKTRVMKA